MRLCLTCEERFFRTPDGRFWSAGPSSYSFTKRYLGAFAEVRVIARTKDVEEPKDGWTQADGEQVKFAPVPHYLGPAEYVRRIRQVSRAVRAGLGKEDALVMRVGSQIASSMSSELRSGRPFGLEVIGDPLNVFAKGSTQHPLRPVWRWWFTHLQRQQCARACAVCYVTGGYLQRLYPCSPAAFSISFLNMELGAEAFVEKARSFTPLPKPLRLITVGGLDQPYKGVDLLLEAVARNVARGRNLELAIVGGGAYKGELERKAESLGLSQRVRFLGSIGAGQPVRNELDRAHLFVLFSKTEGLPRAMIEAMARALPCIGSAVGGIPELLPADCLVPRGDAAGLAAKMEEMVSEPGRLERASAANLDRAKQYMDSVLDAKRNEFLDYLFRATQSWIARGKGQASS